MGGRPVRVGGMCKGSGMIHPNMATMLSVLTCDAPVTADVWRPLVKRAVQVRREAPSPASARPARALPPLPFCPPSLALP